MDDYEKYNLKNDASNILCKRFEAFIDDYNNDKYLYELKEYINDAKRNNFSWSIEKIQIVLSVLQLKNHNDIQEILSYLEQSNYGWQNDKYHFYNRCLNFDQRCRRRYTINKESTAEAFADIDDIFLHKEYGAITTYLFGYSLAALFSSQLKKIHRGIPYFLQIACKRNSNAYRLVHEIVHICDVNTGLFKYCHEYKYIECNHDHMTLYPSDTGDKSLNSLTYYRDIPVIIDGYENERLYESLLRETANIPSRTKRLDLKAKFSILPIFLCPVIHSQFQNILSMDLTNLNITDEYIELILKNKQRLGSWVYQLVTDTKNIFDIGNSTTYFENPQIEKIHELRNPEKKIPLFRDLDNHIDCLRTNYHTWIKLTSKDITNIGYLTYFFSYFMKVFRNSLQLTEETYFKFRGKQLNHNPTKLIEQIKKQVITSLLQLHNTYSPTLSDTININIDSLNISESKRIRRKGATYAKDIIKYYQSYGVSIQILSDAEYKDDRYIFSIKLLPGTDWKLISRYADEVRRLLELEVFIPDITPTAIKLIASEKPLKENSLIKILENPKFKESKMEIPYAIGYDTLGEMTIVDIAEFPHLLIGGTSGSGKSSAIHSLLMSIVYRQPADKVKLLLLDFGSSDLKIFDKVPHMLQPTVRTSEIEKGRQSLLWLQKEMEARLKKKDLTDERKFAIVLSKWPSIVCVIDEFPALIRKLTEGKHNKKEYLIIEDLLERARKVKIHLVLAAQNSSKNSIDIRSTNLGARIAFRCLNRYDSQAIIESSNAVNLSGKGSMYFKCDQHEGLRRLQGSYISPIELMDLLDNMNFDSNNIHESYDEIKYEFSSILKSDVSESEPYYSLVSNTYEEKLPKIILWTLGQEKISNKKIKDEFEMGYDNANKVLDILEKYNIITAQKKGTKLPRLVIPKKIEDISENVKELLIKNKYTESDIQNALTSDIQE